MELNNYTKNTKVVQYNQKVIIANSDNGEWVRISTEVFEIVQAVLAGNKVMYDKESDRQFIDKIIKQLKEMNVIGTEYYSEHDKRLVSIELTHRCNLHCIHCCIDADLKNGYSVDLPTYQLKEILKKCCAWSPRSIMLSGGEPLLRNDFVEILEYLRGIYHGHIILATNGTLFTNENVKYISKYVDQVDVSIDGVDEETTSKIRGKGVFEKVVSGIKLLKSTGFQKITLSMVVGDKTEFLEDRFNELNIELGTKPVVRMFSAVGRGENSKEVFVSTTEDERYIPKTFLEEKYDKPLHICTCNAGKREVFVNYKGDVYPCPSFMDDKHVGGNLLEEDLDSCCDNFSLVESYFGELKKFGKDQYAMCMECPVKLFCWTCPGEISEIRTSKAVRYKCKVMKPLLEKRVWEDT